MNKKIIVLLLLLVPVFSWWDASWNYSKPITSNKNASLVVGHITLDTGSLISSGKMRYDCGDVRVIAGESEADYFISGCNSTYTSIFFASAYSGDEHYLYYGNPSATSESTSSLFTFYDGFSSYGAESNGSFVWTVRKGSVEVNYANSSWRYLLNSSSESVSTAYNPSANSSIFGVLEDAVNGKPGLVYGYINSTHYSAAYLNGSQVWVRENTTHRQIGTFTKQNFNHMKLLFSGNITYVYVNGAIKGGASYYPGYAGVYFIPNETAYASADDFSVFADGNISWSLGSESSVPALVFQFVGSDTANMRTMIASLDEGEHIVKFELNNLDSSPLVSSSQAILDWATINFNSTGYTVDGVYFAVESDSFNYTQGDYRFDLIYVKTSAYYKKWHVVQFFNNFAAIKHIVFLTANQTGTYFPSLTIADSCTGYVSVMGNVSCSANMHASSGVFTFGSASFCGIHWGQNNTLYENITLSSKESYKEIFWQSYAGCGNFTQEIELLCGIDFSNCTSTPIKPARTLFYLKDNPGSLSRFEVPSGLSCRINKESYTELVDSKNLNRGLNDLECYGAGTLSYFRLYNSNPFEATRFFGEKPEVYKVEIAGPATKGKIDKCGIPVFGGFLPYKCSGDSVFVEGNFSEGLHTLYLLKTADTWDYTQTEGGTKLPSKIEKTAPSYPPLAGAREMGPPVNPPTYETISSRQIYYSLETAIEMVVTAWKNI